MERRISTVILLSLVLSDVGALTVDIPKDVYEYARGDNITLPCSFKTKTQNVLGLTIVQWSVEGLQTDTDELQIVSYYHQKDRPNTLDIKKAYEGRVSLDLDIPTGKANLKLSSITLADNKVFECRIQIPGDDEGKPADTARLVVLVAPSKPICKIEGKAEYGQNINLTCKSDEGSPTPVYSWENRDVGNRVRAPAPRTTDKGGILSLYNVSKEASGYYICTSRNKIRSATCNITLAVMPPSMNIGSTAGIIGGVVAGLIALIVIIYCCCCRKKKKEDEYAMGVREDGYTDKEPDRNGESRRADGEEGLDSSVRRSSVDHYEERSERNYEERSERNYDDRRSDYDDRRRDAPRSDAPRSDYDDRRSDYDDRRSDYDDRRSDYTERRDKYSDRNERYDDERRNEDERRYDDSRDRRYDDDRNDESYDDRSRGRPPVPASKPPRDDYDD